MKNLNYKGKGEHSVNELELIINQQAEELHLFNSGQKQLNLSGVVDSLTDKEKIDYEIAQKRKDKDYNIQGWGCAGITVLVAIIVGFNILKSCSS